MVENKKKLNETLERSETTNSNIKIQQLSVNKLWQCLIFMKMLSFVIISSNSLDIGKAKYRLHSFISSIFCDSSSFVIKRFNDFFVVKRLLKKLFTPMNKNIVVLFTRCLINC